MYSLEDAERIAKNSTTREAVYIYLLDKIAEALQTIADDSEQATEQRFEAINSISDGFKGIECELRDIRSSIDDITHELKELNQTHADCEDDLECIFENISSVGAIIAESEVK